MMSKVKTWAAKQTARVTALLDREPLKAAGVCAAVGAVLGLVIGASVG